MIKKMNRSFPNLIPGWAILFFTMTIPVMAQKKIPVQPPVFLNAEGRLGYLSDSLGNRIPDFSYCGYKQSENPIPSVEVKVIVPATQNDATEKIQSAIDYIASLPLANDGFRGAILLQSGEYRVSGRLKVKASGIVLRGTGFGEGGTVIVAAGVDRETLIRFEGAKVISADKEIPIMTDYVPVNALQFTIEDNSGFKAGDKIFIRRPSTKEWIDFLKMNSFGGETDWLGWKPGDRDIIWDRTIVAIDGNSVTIDAPLTTVLDKKYGGGFVSKYNWSDRIENIGIENLALKSEFNTENPKDEYHCWNAISFENARNGWVRQVTFHHFAGSAVAAYETASRITVENCKSFEPVSEIGGWRRYTFFTSGQQILFHNIYAEFGYHDFGTGYCAAGPNAFVQCSSKLPYSFSGSIDSWASGVIFDIVDVDGQALSFKNREQDDYGSGWTAANSMFWQCSAARINCYQPPTAQNWAFGAWAQFSGDGFWYSANEQVSPRSLFYAQLADRIGKEKLPSDPVIENNTNSTSAPTIELAAELTALSVNPTMTVDRWIDQTCAKNPIDIAPGSAPIIDQIKMQPKNPKTLKAPALMVKDGWLVRGDRVMVGNRFTIPWWRGSLRPRVLNQSNPALTRYVPGRTGTGYTDNLEEVTETMKQNGVITIEQHYALWCDRRRDDHERIRRIDGEAWAPFYELPFARSGKELAWDGLSKYDLTKYNLWYWDRLKQFTDLADQKGLILIHQNYFQHNIIEAGAHWVDNPWRTANNINSTGFPEPPFYAGEKRIYFAEQFYDLSNPTRRELNRLYIRQCLENFKDNNGVIQLIGEEFTGPLHFVQFWIDVIAEWEKETGRHQIIGLSTTKDVQDSILADPVRSKIIDLIDIRYWTGRDDGSVYDPEGGKSLAPRQFGRIEKVGKQNFESVYADVLKYRTKFPEKAVMYSFNRATNLAWAIFMAGGSLAHIPPVAVDGFLEQASDLFPGQSKKGEYRLENHQGEKIIYLVGKKDFELPAIDQPGNFSAYLINPENGQLIGKPVTMKKGKNTILDLNGKSQVVVWVRKTK